MGSKGVEFLSIFSPLVSVGFLFLVYHSVATQGVGPKVALDDLLLFIATC